MSDEPRDGQPDSAQDPADHAVDPLAPTDGSRTDVSAPWERPRRWERNGPAANRVDALLARLGDDPDSSDDAETGEEPDTRRSRRKNKDGDTVPASELIAAIGDGTDSDADPTLESPAEDGTDGDADPPAEAGEDSDVAAADAHTDTFPKTVDKAADLAEAGAIRASLDREAGVGAPEVPTDPPPPDVKTSGGRKKAASTPVPPAAVGATLVHGSGPRRHRSWLYAGRTVAALVAFCTLLGVGVEWKITDRAEKVLSDNSVTAALNTTDPSISTARTTAVVRTNSQGVTTTEAAPPKTVYKPENILLLGSDTRAGANEAIGGSDGETDTSQSDTLMVAHISGDREHVTVLSIPRDTIIPAPTNCHSWSAKTNTYAKEVYATDPGQTFHITNTYAVGGPACLVSAVQGLTGLGITRLIGIDFKGFQSMVGALGGVTVNICKPIFDTVLGNVAPKGGVQVVQGQQALNLVRARHVVGETESDLARIRRQQVVLSAILRQVTQAGTLLNPGKLDGFLQAFTKNTFTQNVKLQDLVTLAGSLGSLDPAHVTFYTLPTLPRDDGALDVDKAKAAPVFDDLVNDQPLPGEVTTPAKPKPTATATPPAPTSLKLTVAPAKVALELYNVSGRDNVAGMAQQELNAAGFSIDDDQLFLPGTTQAATVVQYAPTNRAAALTVAAAVPGSTLLVTPGLGKTVRLQLGSSFAGVVKTVTVGQQAPASLSTAISTGASVKPSRTATTALSSVNAAAGTCA